MVYRFDNCFFYSVPLTIQLTKTRRQKVVNKSSHGLWAKSTSKSTRRVSHKRRNFSSFFVRLVLFCMCVCGMHTTDMGQRVKVVISWITVLGLKKSYINIERARLCEYLDCQKIYKNKLVQPKKQCVPSVTTTHVYHSAVLYIEFMNFLFQLKT